MPTEGEAVRPSVITRRECRVHGYDDEECCYIDCEFAVERTYECEHHVAQMRGEIERERDEARTSLVKALAEGLRIKDERDEAREQLAQAQEGYWAADEVLEALRSADNLAQRSTIGTWAAGFLERRFSGEEA